jgi:hypothetical protein
VILTIARKPRSRGLFDRAQALVLSGTGRQTVEGFEERTVQVDLELVESTLKHADREQHAPVCGNRRNV